MNEDAIRSIIQRMDEIAQKELRDARERKQPSMFWDGYTCALEELILRLDMERTNNKVGS